MLGLRGVSELLARKTGRRGLLSRSAQLATGALIGVAAGSTLATDRAAAGGTVCVFPGPPCPCEGCNSTTGACKKPCMFVTAFYASGCWVTDGVTCCDCSFPGVGWCGCGTDYHTNNCPA